MGAHGVLRQGWQLGGQRWRGKKGEGRSWPPSSQPTGPPSRSWVSGLGLPCGGGERDAFQVSGGGDVMWGGGGAHRSGTRDWGFPLYFLRSLYSFSTACLPLPRRCPPAAPYPSSGKSLSSTLLWVASSSQVRILGFTGYLCISSAPH